MNLYRIQDADGRGPWKPGFSKNWIDWHKDDSLCPPIQVEFPNWKAVIQIAGIRGFTAFGCCVAGMAGLHRWFTPDEMRRLARFGYNLIDASAMTPICTGKSQIIAGWTRPLRELPALPWAVAHDGMELSKEPHP